MRVRWTVALIGGAVLLSVSVTGGTYAVFSDSVSSAGTVAAGTVAIDSAGGAPPSLRYQGLLPGEPRTDDLPLRYAGSIAGDLFLDVAPGGGTPYCLKGIDGSWAPAPGGVVELQVHGQAWVDYCSLLDGSRYLTLQTNVEPRTDLDLDIDIRLRAGADRRYSDLTDSDVLTVRARESGTAAGFSDTVVGTIEISTGSIRPAIPQQCIDAGLTDFDADNTVYLTDGDDVYETGKQPQRGRGFLVFGFGGDDHIVGSNQGDCIDGGDGDDELWGDNQGDVVIGGPGNDVLNKPDGDDDPTHSNGKDLLYGGDGDDVIYGGNAKDSLSGDSLFGQDGDDTLVGGRGTDLLDGGGQVTRDLCIDAIGTGGADSTDRFQNCEDIVRAPEGAQLAGLMTPAG